MTTEPRSGGRWAVTYPSGLVVTVSAPNAEQALAGARRILVHHYITNPEALLVARAEEVPPHA